MCCCIPGRCPIWTQCPPAAGDPPAAAAQIAASFPASWGLCPLLGAGEGLARPWWPGVLHGHCPGFHGPPGPVMAARGRPRPRLAASAAVWAAALSCLASGLVWLPGASLALSGGPLAAAWVLLHPWSMSNLDTTPTAAGDPPAAAAQIAASFPASWGLCPLLGVHEGLARPWWPGALPGCRPGFHGPVGPVMAARGRPRPRLAASAAVWAAALSCLASGLVWLPGASLALSGGPLAAACMLLHPWAVSNLDTTPTGCR